MLAAGSIVGHFRDDPAVIAIGTPALRAQCLATYGCMIMQCTNMLYQSVGKSTIATVLASLRSGICFIPLILLLPRLFGTAGIIWAQPAADILAAMVTVPFLFYFLKTLPPDAPVEQ